MDGQSGTCQASYAILNLGNNRPAGLLDFIHTLEDALGTKAKLKLVEHHYGDVLKRATDIDETHKKIYYYPKVENQTRSDNFCRLV